MEIVLLLIIILLLPKSNNNLLNILLSVTIIGLAVYAVVWFAALALAAALIVGS